MGVGKLRTHDFFLSFYKLDDEKFKRGYYKYIQKKFNIFKLNGVQKGIN